MGSSLSENPSSDVHAEAIQTVPRTMGFRFAANPSYSTCAAAIDGRLRSFAAGGGIRPGIHAGFSGRTFCFAATLVRDVVADHRRRENDCAFW